MKLNAFNLKLIDRHFLRSGYALSKWPVIEIDIDDNKIKDTACIASWRWDVDTIFEFSNRLSECAWDALNLNFKYLLCDLISIKQDPEEVSESIVRFSNLYKSLHCVISYDTDPDIKRTWLRNEAAKILNSPTSLLYIYHKWKLKVPLIPSLIIRQICTTRLGLHDLNFDKLELCDTDLVYELKMIDLDLFSNKSRETSTISLDRRFQKYASDVLLVYEINKIHLRFDVISSLNSISSNSILIPALLCIIALVDGLSVGVRGCDWDVNKIPYWVHEILLQATKNLPQRIEVILQSSDTIVLTGAVSCKLKLHYVLIPYDLQPGTKNIFVFKDGDQKISENENFVEELLVNCINFTREMVEKKIVEEPLPLTDNDPQFDLYFDNNKHY